MTKFGSIPASKRESTLVAAGRAGLLAAGYSIKKVPNPRGIRLLDLTKDGRTVRAVLKTAQNRDFGFVPNPDKGGFHILSDKTLDVVVVAAVPVPKEEATTVEVHIFQASDVLSRSKAALAARKQEGHTIKPGWPVFIRLDTDDREIAASVGSGIADASPPILSVSLSHDEGDAVLERRPKESEDDTTAVPAVPNESPTIPNIIGRARAQIAALVGVAPELVKLDLRIDV